MVRVLILAACALATAALVLYVAVFDTSEFRGLGFLLMHLMVITPVLLICPFVVHIGAPKELRKPLLLFNGLILLELFASWVVLLNR